MCDICHQRTCPSACPNARVMILGRCDICGDDVTDAEERIRTGGRYYHYDCLRTLKPEEWLDGFGADYEKEE